MKIGREVEGRFRGLLTLFVDYKEAHEFFMRPSVKEAALNREAKDLIEKVRHVYISDHGNQMQPDAKCLKIWGDLGFIVCLERTHVGYAERHEFHEKAPHVVFMLALKNDVLWSLFDEDQVKFTYSKHNDVLSMSVGKMDATTSDEFLGDVVVQLPDVEQYGDVTIVNKQ